MARRFSTNGVLGIFRELQKHCQKADLVLPDVIKYTLEKLKLMQSGPYPRGQEQILTDRLKKERRSQDGRKVSNSLVTTSRRDYYAVRTEILQCPINFISQQLCIEEEQAVEHMIRLVRSTSVEDFIVAAKPLFKFMPHRFSQRDFVSEVIEDFQHMKPEVYIRASYKIASCKMQDFVKKFFEME